MKLLSCHIDNFGNLSGQDFSFEPGVNVFLRENGWGKTTLATFILVMFYGFDEKENERERYDPWQGGTYGGSLRFESNGKTLEVARTFGSAPEQDTAVLTDVLSGRSFPLEFNLGEKLFSIDRASFRRTAFMGQNDNTSVGASSDIIGRISGLTDNLSELDSYEKAMDRLDQALWGKGQDSAMGKSASLREDVRRLEVELDALEDSEEQLEKKQQELREAHSAEYEVRRKQEELVRTQSEAIRLSEAAAKKEEYRRLDERRQNARRRQEELESRFPNGVPEKEELNEALDALKKQLKNAAVRSPLALTPEEEEQLKSLEDKFADPDLAAVATLSIARAERLNDKRTEVEEKKKEMEGLPEEPEKKKDSPLLLILGIVVLVIGLDAAFYGYFSHPWIIFAGAGVALVGLVLLIIGIIRFSKAVKMPASDEKTRAGLRLEIENDEAAIRDEEEALATFFDSHGIAAEKGKEEAAARELFNEISRMEELRSQEEAAAQEEAEAQAAISGTVDRFLDRYGFQHTENPLGQIFEIQNDVERYEMARTEAELAEKAATLYEENNNVERILSTDTSNIPAAEGLQEALEEANNGIREAMDKEKALSQSVLRLSSDLEEKEELEGELALVREALEKEEKRTVLLARTRMHLEEARNAQSERYMAPLMEGFRYYYGLLSGGAEDYVIDDNAGIRALQYGSVRDADSLSTGTQDLIGLSLRLSLVDAMYTGEKPFLVMDDPFVNFDLQKTSEGQAFLKEVGEKYQIIYFTCHESRA